MFLGNLRRLSWHVYMDGMADSWVLFLLITSKSCGSACWCSTVVGSIKAAALM